MTTAIERSSQSDEMTVQLLLANNRNQQLVAQQLTPEYTVQTTNPDDLTTISFDVCILDPPSFERYHEALVTKKQQVDPVFLPYLLVTEEERTERIPNEILETIDEVVVKPLSPTELTYRLENLLERRQLSVDLNRRKERSEERFQTLFDTAPDPVVVTSPDGTISNVNRAFAETIGEPRMKLIGQSITEVGFSPTEAVERVLLRVVDTNKEVSGSPSSEDSVALELEQDDSIVTELNADIVTALGEASERIGIFRDITERKQRETDLREQNERLEEFAATIAHDLRNPLSIAQGHLELMRETDNDDHFEAVDQAHDRMERMIDEILTLARQGQLVMEPESVSLETTAKQAWEHVVTDESSLSVEESQQFLVDCSRLIECFENLFRNAVEHSDSPVSVRVGRLTSHEHSGFFVADDGPGIPEDERADVFEAGFTKSRQGTGFGLSIVQQIAEGHDWDIKIKESQSGGARFTIENVSTPTNDGSEPQLADTDR